MSKGKENTHTIIIESGTCYRIRYNHAKKLTTFQTLHCSWKILSIYLQDMFKYHAFKNLFQIFASLVPQNAQQTENVYLTNKTIFLCELVKETGPRFLS